MKRHIAGSLPFPVAQTLKKFGADIKIARLKRGLTSDMMAEGLGIHRSTYGKVENGDPMVALGIYANALFALGFGTPLGDLVDPRRDEAGLLLDLARLPKRVRTRRFQTSFLMVGSGRRHGPAAENVLKIGVVGAMSGPYALWGLVSKYAAQATADMYDEDGGVEISGEKYRIEIVAIDDKLDPQRAASAAERLTTQEGIRYIIGPNVEQTIASAAPVAEKNSSMLFPYSFTRSYYLPPHENTVLSQIAGYQAWPIIFGYLRDRKNVKAVSVLAPNSPEGLMQRREAISAATKLELRLLSIENTYESGSRDFSRVIAETVKDRPDLIVLSNLAPVDAPRLMRTAREIGFNGFFATEAAQDITVLNQGAGTAANGLFTLGGASTPETRSPYMDKFIDRYRKRAGDWNDEAGTKAYALELILGTLRMTGKDALRDINLFKKAIQPFAMANPFVKGEPTLSYVGAPYFRKKRQIGVPMVINTVRDGKFETLLVGSVD